MSCLAIAATSAHPPPLPLNCPSRPTLDCDLALHPRRVLRLRRTQLFLLRGHQRCLFSRRSSRPWPLCNGSQTRRKRDWDNTWRSSTTTTTNTQCTIRAGIPPSALAPVDLLLHPLLEVDRGSRGALRRHGTHEPRSLQNLVRLRTAHRAGSLVAAPPAALKHRAGLPRAAAGRPGITACERLVLVHRRSGGLPAPTCTATAPGIPASAATAAASSAAILPS